MKSMKRIKLLFAFVALLTLAGVGNASAAAADDQAAQQAQADELKADDSMYESGEAADMGMHQLLKKEFVDGNPGFMSLVAIALIVGLAFCIERIIYLSLAETNGRKLLTEVEKAVQTGNIEQAKKVCRETRGPVASICYQGLMRIGAPMESIESGIKSYGGVQIARLERGCSWISMLIMIAPSLGFLGTVIGMVMAFEQIQQVGDIGPTVVASGMKVALITTVFGIIVAIILQLFYNFILTRIDRLTIQMEEASIELLDIIGKAKKD